MPGALARIIITVGHLSSAPPRLGLEELFDVFTKPQDLLQPQRPLVLFHQCKPSPPSLQQRADVLVPLAIAEIKS